MVFSRDISLTTLYHTYFLSSLLSLPFLSTYHSILMKHNFMFVFVSHPWQLRTFGFNLISAYNSYLIIIFGKTGRTWGYFQNIWYRSIFFQIFQSNRQLVWIFPCFVRVENPFFNLKLHLHYITLRIKTKTISSSVFSSQILQNEEINIVVHWNFFRKYGSVSHLFSCRIIFEVIEDKWHSRLILRLWHWNLCFFFCTAELVTRKISRLYYNAI